MAHRRPVSDVSLENSERDYENVMPPHLLRLQQVGARPTVKAGTGVPSHTASADDKGYSSRRASIVILYLLVCVSLAIATAAFVLTILKITPYCPNGWQNFQTKCYYYSIHKHTWDGAMNVCHGFGAHLAMINGDNATEQGFPHHNSSYWIGLRLYGKQWMWADGTLLSDKIKFQNASETSCVFWEKNTKNVSSCSSNLHYICEKQLA